MSKNNEAIERDADFTALNEQPAVDNAQQQSSAQAQDTETQGNVESPNLLALQAEIAKLKTEVDDYKEKYLRSLADFENAKKRSLKERSELLKYQGERFITDILEVVDNFDLALGHVDADADKFRAGIKMIHKLFNDILSKHEIVADSALGKDFDPYKHEALSKLVVENAKPNSIINEMRKAYFYKDKLIRPAQVVVAAAPAVETAKTESQDLSAASFNQAEQKQEEQK